MGIYFSFVIANVSVLISKKVARNSDKLAEIIVHIFIQSNLLQIQLLIALRM